MTDRTHRAAKDTSAKSVQRLSDAQLLTLLNWVDLVGSERGSTPQQVFPRRDNTDNAMRRTCTALLRKGALVPVDERLPAHEWRYRPAPWALLLLAHFATEEAQS